ncbi:MAG: hypothetical protein ACLQDY_26945 [Streptosporangiaceae bacterium]
MLYAFGFDRIGVLVSDLYFVDPRPAPGQEGAERGVRLEIRMLEPGELTGSIYSARPIQVGRPVWRADLLEAADAPGTMNRAHHHPAFRGWEPGRRVFDPELSASPVQWVGNQLADLEKLLRQAGIEPDGELAVDAARLRETAGEITDAVSRLLARVNAGQLAASPAEGAPDSARMSWL